MWTPASKHTADLDSDADEIVDEIPVYLAKNVPHLSLYQFTSRTVNDQLDRSHVLQSSVKPGNQEARLEYALDTRSKHYDAFKGDQFAIAADGLAAKSSLATAGRQFPDGRMDRQAFQSSRPLDNTDRFLVGIMQDRELHVTPLNGGILQLRPTFAYFDKSDVRSRAEKKAENDADLDEEEAKQVTVQFARTDTDSARKAKEKSFGVLAQRSADEPWCETVYHGRDSSEAAQEREKLFATNQTETNNLNLSNREYLEALIPARKTDTEYEKLLPNTVVSLDKLKLYSLADQLRTILKDGRVLRFETLMRLLGDPALSAERVLQTLPSVGLLVLGNWTVLSEILYAPGTLSGINGVPAELMCRARDYILFKLSRGEPLDRVRIAGVTQIPPDEVKEIAETVATYDRRAKRWQLLLPADEQFERKYVRHRERQDLYWRANEQRFRALEEADRSAATGGAASADAAVAAVVQSKRKRTKSTRSDGGK